MVTNSVASGSVAPSPAEPTIQVFIDGEAGTTGLQLRAQLETHPNVALLQVDSNRRKDRQARATLLAAADVAILCLPDEAAREAVDLCEGAATRIIDASTAHRTAQNWEYGLPELGVQKRARLREATRVANPGCYPQGFILAVRPLIANGWLDPARPLAVHAVSGYSGGGRSLIERLEGLAAEERESWVVRPYALHLQHKHLPEMQRYSGCEHTPLFAPSVGAYYKGMLVSTMLPEGALADHVCRDDVHAVLERTYADEPFVHVLAPTDAAPDGYLGATACNDSNRLELIVCGNDRSLMLTARYDNLGKGAAGAAVQNLNCMFGLPETTGLSA